MSFDDFGLGRRPSLDERDASFPMRAALPKGAATGRIEIPKQKTWRLRQVLDQGSEPRCVGYSLATMLRCEPYFDRTPDPDSLYFGAQQLDEWDGPPPPYDGSSVRGGAKHLASLGELTEYRWATSLQDILDWIALKGPVVVGTSWLSGMFTTEAGGNVNVEGADIGGHAYCLIGKNDLVERVTIANTWGLRWGKRTAGAPRGNGRGYMRYADLDRLVFRQDGEAVVAIKSRKR